MNKIDEKDIDEFVDKYLKEQEEKRWKNEDRFNNFLEYLIKYVDKEKRVLSDDFYYNEDKCKPYTFREFESYLYSLYDIVDDYANKNFVYNGFNLTKEDYFTESSYCLKIKDKFYKIELVIGQGSYICFGLTNNNKNISYVDYNLMIKDEKSPLYEHLLKEIVQDNLNNLVKELAEKGADEEIVKKFIKEYK